jgi:hypothetical protein
MAVRDLRDDFEDDFEQFAQVLRWTDAVPIALTVPLLLMLFWWWVR